MAGRVVAVCVSEAKGTPKRPVDQVEVREGWGIVGDAHSGDWGRQLSLLAFEEIEEMNRRLGLAPPAAVPLAPGDFAENVTVEGAALGEVKVGDVIKLGPSVSGVVTQIGKECHSGCSVFKRTGHCIMPTRGIFLKVLAGGLIRPDDAVTVEAQARSATAGDGDTRIGVLTVSDKASRGERGDASGDLASELAGRVGRVCAREVVPDEPEQIQAVIKRWADELSLDLVLTTGGTGLSPRDRTPEATLGVVDRLVPGIPEAMRAAALARTANAMLSRGIAGIRGRTLVINLPGSPKAVRECLEVISPALGHGIAVMRGEVSECARLQELRPSTA